MPIPLEIMEKRKKCFKKCRKRYPVEHQGHENFRNAAKQWSMLSKQQKKTYLETNTYNDFVASFLGKAKSKK